jgi:choline dehydrogenase-like flavoprotein
MRANDTDVVVDASVAGASIAAVLARGGSEVLLLSRPHTACPVRRSPASPRNRCWLHGGPNGLDRDPCAVFVHAVTSAPKRQIWSPRARLPTVMPLADGTPGLNQAEERC